jgi:signal transduction histidine kinase
MTAARWWRRVDTLAARFVVVLVGGLTLSQGVGLAILAHERSTWVQEVQTRVYAARIAELLQAARSLDPQALQSFSQRLGAPQLTVVGASMPQSSEGGQPMKALRDELVLRGIDDSAIQAHSRAASATDLRNRLLWLPPLDAAAGDAVRPALAAVEDDSLLRRSAGQGRWLFDPGVPPGPGRADLGREQLRHVSVQVSGLAAGTVRLDYLMPAPGGLRIHVGAIRYFLLTGAVLILLSLLAARMVTGPLRRLADAAEHLGRDLTAAPLPEIGPREVAAAARCFNGMQQRLLRFVQGRADALAAISHDLRTPITRMRLRAEMLPNRERQGFAEDVLEVDAMIQSTLNFLRGIDEQEAEARLDAGWLLTDAVGRIEELGRQVLVAAAPACLVRARPLLLRRALINLLDNACKYGRDVRASIERRAGEVVFRIEDRGPGVPDVLLAQLGRPFFRVESSRNRGTGGYGLGLSIVKDIAERHGGRLILSNHPSGGFVAELCLPST